MPDLRSASAASSSFIPDETSRLFHVALHEVVRSSAVSMADLRNCVRACTRSLRDANLGPVQMILAIKACAKDGSRQFPTVLAEHELSNADFLMDEIVKWAIIEYYRDS
jgi:hypothetical protein